MNLKEIKYLAILRKFHKQGHMKALNINWGANEFLQRKLWKLTAGLPYDEVYAAGIKLGKDYGWRTTINRSTKHLLRFDTPFSKQCLDLIIGRIEDVC